MVVGFGLFAGVDTGLVWLDHVAMGLPWAVGNLVAAWWVTLGILPWPYVRGSFGFLLGVSPWQRQAPEALPWRMEHWGQTCLLLGLVQGVLMLGGLLENLSGSFGDFAASPELARPFVVVGWGIAGKLLLVAPAAHRVRSQAVAPSSVGEGSKTLLLPVTQDSLSLGRCLAQLLASALLILGYSFVFGGSLTLWQQPSALLAVGGTVVVLVVVMLVFTAQGHSFWRGMLPVPVMGRQNPTNQAAGCRILARGSLGGAGLGIGYGLLVGVRNMTEPALFGHGIAAILASLVVGAAFALGFRTLEGYWATARSVGGIKAEWRGVGSLYFGVMGLLVLALVVKFVKVTLS